MARPSVATDELKDFILEGLTESCSLRQICADEAMPNRSTIARWLSEDESFATKYVRVRDMQGDYMDDLVLETANGCTPETASADRVKIAAYQWRAAKLKPKVYGDKQQVEHSGSIGIGTALDSLPDA